MLLVLLAAAALAQPAPVADDPLASTLALMRMADEHERPLRERLAAEVGPQERACDAGDGAACGRAAQAWGDARLAEGHARADALAAKGCTLRDGVSCAIRADHLLSGFVVAKDVTEGARLARLACDLGADRGCTLWARALETGEGATKDVPTAFVHYDRSCDRGDRFACYSVGRLCTNGGPGVAVDRTRALEAYGRSCTLGFDDACYRAGLNRVAAGDKVTARAWFERGCTAGSRLACEERDVLDGKPRPADDWEY